MIRDLWNRSGPIEKTLFDKHGEAVAYLTDDYHQTIYLWEGYPAAYLYDDRHIYGINGRHLGWFIDEIIYNQKGERIGFTSRTCPMALAKEVGKNKKYPMDQFQPKWAAPSLPRLSFVIAEQDLRDFFKEGRVAPFRSGTESTEISK